MKKLFTLCGKAAILAMVACLALFHNTTAQCVSPSLVFKNATLVSGTAGQVGATYKFPGVTNYADAYIKIDSLVGGASLADIDKTDIGYPDAWQPVVNGPSNPPGNISYIRWSITFKAIGTNLNQLFPCFTLSAVDIDGDNSKIREFIEAINTSSYSNTTPTTLTITQSGNDIRALGSVANKADIDTLADDTRIKFVYNSVSSIQIKTGSYINPGSNGNGSTARYNCLYFRNITASLGSLPVRFVSFSARALKSNTVQVNWVTETEVNNKQFEIQRSGDGINFSTVGIVLSIDGGNNLKAYQYTDKMQGTNKGKFYYRIKQVDLDNKYTLSKIAVVNLSDAGRVFVKSYPNPVTTDFTISMENVQHPAKSVRISNLMGKEVYRKNLTGAATGVLQLNAQSANMNVPGIYVAEIALADGSVITEKIIKR
jgi:hypothetical protein